MNCSGMTAQQISFVKASLPAAIAAGTAFNMNPSVILTQGAFESGWGTSELALRAHNFFGLTAYGCSNAYWHGQKYPVRTSRDELDFRWYGRREDSFLDFARLIRNNYRTAWSKSENPSAYAHEIAYSRYISELNGDDRETYRRSLIQIEKTVQAILSITFGLTQK